MNILFLHSSRHIDKPWLDGSTRYRCYHMADALRAQGHRADVTVLRDIKAARLRQYSAVVVLRPTASRTLERLLHLCRQSGILTIADVDDLVFVPEFAAQSPRAVNGQSNVFTIRAQFKRHREAMLCFDRVSVSTQPLADHWLRTGNGSPVTVIPNGLSQRWLRTPLLHNSMPHASIRTITYLSGTKSHDKDFMLVQEVLMDCLLANPDVVLKVIGSLEITHQQFPDEQFHQIPAVPYDSLPQVITDSCLTIAPLEDTPFNHAKSHIKFTESAAFGTPIVCSPNHDLCRHEISGLTIASNVEEWAQAITCALAEPLNTTESELLRQHVLSSCMASDATQKLIDIVEPTYPESLPRIVGL